MKNGLTGSGVGYLMIDLARLKCFYYILNIKVYSALKILSLNYVTFYQKSYISFYYAYYYAYIQIYIDIVYIYT